jgi:hypothetical protein
MSKTKASKINRELLAEFIRNILPYPNNVTSYRIMINKLKLNKRFRKNKKVCSICYKLIEKCSCEDKANLAKINVSIFDIRSQFKRILEKCWNKVVEYKSKIKNSELV